MQAAKEKVCDIAASAKSGFQKTKAILEEKKEKMLSHDPAIKEKAREKREERIEEAERQKQMAYEENAAARHGTSWAGGSPTTTGHTTEAFSRSTTLREHLNRDPHG